MDRLAGLRDEVGTANRTRGVGTQPGVDAVRVENVVALGYQTQRFVVLEFVQAHRALQRAFPDLQPFHCGVGQGREGIDDLLIEPTRGRRVSGEDACRDAVAALDPRAVADVDGEESHEEERGNQNDDDYRHRGAELGVGVVALGRAGLGRGPRNLQRQESKQKQIINASMLRGAGQALLS